MIHFLQQWPLDKIPIYRLDGLLKIWKKKRKVHTKTGIKKLAIRTLTDTNGIDPEFYLDYSNPPGQVSPLKETTAMEKERINLLLKVGDILRTMAKKLKNYGQVGKIVVHLKNTPTYYLKYKNIEAKVKAMIGLKHKEGVVRVVATEERNACKCMQECNYGTRPQK